MTAFRELPQNWCTMELNKRLIGASCRCIAGAVVNGLLTVRCPRDRMPRPRGYDLVSPHNRASKSRQRAHRDQRLSGGADVRGRDQRCRFVAPARARPPRGRGGLSFFYDVAKVLLEDVLRALECGEQAFGHGGVVSERALPGNERLLPLNDDTATLDMAPRCFQATLMHDGSLARRACGSIRELWRGRQGRHELVAILQAVEQRPAGRNHLRVDHHALGVPFPAMCPAAHRGFIFGSADPRRALSAQCREVAESRRYCVIVRFVAHGSMPRFRLAAANAATSHFKAPGGRGKGPAPPLLELSGSDTVRAMRNADATCAYRFAQLDGLQPSTRFA